MGRAWVVMVLCAVLGLVPPAVAQEGATLSDAEMALGYYQPLAEQGEPYAQLTIGEIYMEGAGVEQDLVQAYAWFAVAREQGLEEAGAIMDHLFGKLTENERRQAKVLAQEFIKAYIPRRR